MRTPSILLLLLTIGGCDKLKELTGGGDEAASSAKPTKRPKLDLGSHETEVLLASGEDAKPAEAGAADGKAEAPRTAIDASQCGDVTDGGPVNGPDCITAEIECGQTIIGHTRGGVKKYNTRWYEKSTCWPATRNHNGGDERVYLFKYDKSPMAVHDADYARLTFETPCADLDISAFRSLNPRMCPNDPESSCDMINPFAKGKKTRRSMKIRMDKGEYWFFLVEGADEEEGAFSLTLDCTVGG